MAAVSGKRIETSGEDEWQPTVTKSIPTKFIGVWKECLYGFQEQYTKIKAHGKLIEMADKHYVGGDIYEMMIPVKKYYSQGTQR